ncbi:MAG: SRPBCC domain-containing protein [Fimbriimonas sp.]
MSDTPSPSSTRNTKRIGASPEAVYHAFLDPDALVKWLAPGDMTGEIHAFDPRVGGGYEMSLFYSEGENLGKTAAREDRFTARFVELSPPARIVQAITFASENAAFAGEMTMTATFTPKEDGTEVTLAFDNLPPGVRPEDNEAGTEQSLAKLAALLEEKAG